MSKINNLAFGGFPAGVIGFGCFADAGNLLAGSEAFAPAGESYFVVECVDYEGAAGNARHKFEADSAVDGVALVGVDVDCFAMEQSACVAKSDNEIPAFSGRAVTWLPGERANGERLVGRVANEAVADCRRRQGFIDGHFVASQTSSSLTPMTRFL